MLLIFALVALLSLSVTSLPTNTTGLALNNVTTSNVNDHSNNASDTNELVWINPNPRCWWGGAPDWEKRMPGDCRCWHDGPGIYRGYFVSAIEKACDRFAGGIGDPVSLYGMGPGLQQGRTSWYQYQEYVALETVTIAVSLNVFHDTVNCLGPLPVSREYCWNSLHAAVDACNTGGVDGKHGGYIKSYVSSTHLTSLLGADHGQALPHVDHRPRSSDALAVPGHRLSKSSAAFKLLLGLLTGSQVDAGKQGIGRKGDLVLAEAS